MKLQNGYALTTHEDEDGAEWQVRLSYDYQPFEGPDYEDGQMVYPGCESGVTEVTVERNEPIYDVDNWVEFDEATDIELAGWAEEIHELINTEGE